MTTVLRSESGFGLLEVLASVTLFAMVAAALSASTVGEMKANHTSRHVAAASALVYDQIDRFRALPPDSPALAAGSHSDPLNPLSSLGASQGMYTRTWVVTPNTPRPGVARVDITVSWNNPEERSVTAVTYVCPRRACIVA